MIKRSLYRRLERLEARVQADRAVLRYRVLFVGGGPAGELATVIGPDGRMVWWNPPEGSEVGGLAHERSNFEDGLRHLEITFEGKEVPTTVRGPDGRLVWAHPPVGGKEGEPIEDSREDQFSSERDTDLREYDHNPS
jgi:hypothetical protein